MDEMDDKPLKPDFKQMLHMYQQNRDEFEKLIHEQARLMRICYQSLIAEGFNEIQALEIIKARGCMLG